MPANESYYDRSSMDSEYMEEESESSIGGILKKKAMEHKGMEEKGDKGEFTPVSDEYGNELCVYAEDFPELADMPRGSEIMFVVRGAVKGVDKMGKREKVTCFIWDAKLCKKDDK